MMEAKFDRMPKHGEGRRRTMATPILYYWEPCTTCANATRYANEHGLDLDLRDVEQVAPYEELLALGGDANKIPYLYDGEQLCEGLDAVLEYLEVCG